MNRLKQGTLAALGVTAVLVSASQADARKAKAESMVAWLHTSSNLNGDAPSTWGFNAVDGKPTTAWCTASGAVGQALTMGFVKPVTITHVSVIPGALKGDGLDKRRARVHELEMNDGRQKRTLTLEDEGKPQELQLEAAIKVSQLVFTVRSVFPGASEASPVCISEITLRNGDHEILGELVARQARGVTRPVLGLTGVWLDNPSAPERFLTLNLNGTFVWSYSPLLEGDPARLVGKWDLSGRKISFKAKGVKPFTLRYARKRASETAELEKLTLTGAGGHEKLAGTYQPRVVLGE